ncbi:hypothetical protein V497_04815 [Pseudogymnoascus sp. VKM F-4516 (FW-969)]|nr:hypothetical protein V497_04815 [Pseudogymnoascus sp. VKM F-4516 (FW-969)]
MGAYERVPCREIIDTARHSQTPRRCFERAEAKSTRARKTHTPSSRLLPWGRNNSTHIQSPVYPSNLFPSPNPSPRPQNARQLPTTTISMPRTSTPPSPPSAPKAASLRPPNPPPSSSPKPPSNSHPPRPPPAQP